MRFVDQHAIRTLGRAADGVLEAVGGMFTMSSGASDHELDAANESVTKAGVAMQTAMSACAECPRLNDLLGRGPSSAKQVLGVSALVGGTVKTSASLVCAYAVAAMTRRAVDQILVEMEAADTELREVEASLGITRKVSN